MVESAIVFPTVVLVVIFLITFGINLIDKTQEYSEEWGKTAKEIIRPSLSQEELLRWRYGLTDHEEQTAESSEKN